MDVMAPPSILDYTYSDENTSPVWRYVSLTVTERAGSRLPKCSKIEFSGPKHFQMLKKTPGVPLKFNLPTFGDILFGLRLPEVPHFCSNKFDADIAG